MHPRRDGFLLFVLRAADKHPYTTYLQYDTQAPLPEGRDFGIQAVDIGNAFEDRCRESSHPGYLRIFGVNGKMHPSIHWRLEVYYDELTSKKIAGSRDV